MTEIVNTKATYTRLRSGSWGVRVPEAAARLRPGETTTIEVHKLNGQINSETVRCFWAGDDLTRETRIALCELVPKRSASPGSPNDPGHATASLRSV